MELTLSQVENTCDTTTCGGCDFSQHFAEILEGPDVSDSVQAQSTNDKYEETSDYDVSSSDDENMRERSSLSKFIATAQMKY